MASFGVADLDGDGILDVYVTRTDGALERLPGLGGGRFGAPVQIPTRAPGRIVAAADFDQDGDQDLVVWRSSGPPGDPGPWGSLSLLLTDAHGDFEERDLGADFSSRVFAADLDRDGIVDLVVLGRDSSDETYPVLFLRGDGTGAFSSRVAARLVWNEVPSAVADLDGDGRLDLLLFVDSRPITILVYVTGDGKGGFSGPSRTIGYQPVSTPFVGDVDGDGRLDVVAVTQPNGLLYAVTVFRGVGAGHFLMTAAVPIWSEIRELVDLDGDGILDVLATSGDDGLLVFPASRDGGLGVPVRIGDGMAQAADVTGDGRADLLQLESGGCLSVRERVCGAGPANATLVVPVVVATTGVNGARYASELTLLNRGPTGASLLVRSSSERSSLLSAFALPAGEQLPSVRRLGFGILGLPYEGPASGTVVRIQATGLSTPFDVGGVVRVVSTVQGSSDRGGVAFPVLRYEETFDGTAIVGWLLETASDRSNMALVNVEETGDVTLRVTVVSTDPAHPGSATLPEVTLGPGIFKQLDRVLAVSGLGATSGFARIERVAGTGRFYAYGVVNDNGTSDGSFVAAQAVGSRTGETTLVVPAVVEAGSFTSEVVVTNTSSTARRLRLEYVADAIATGDRTARLVLELAAGAALDVDRYVDALRTLGAPGVGPAGGIFAGALFVTVLDGDAEGLFVGARTSSAAVRGRYGVFTPAVPLGRSATSIAWLHGLKQDDLDRTNVAIVNAGAEADVFRVEIFDGDTGLLAATVSDVRVEPKGWRQLGRVLADHAPGVSNGYAKVTRVTGTAPFVAYAVINDGTGPGLGTGDGSYVPMSITEEMR